MHLWQLVELDFQEHYSIDLSTPGLLDARPWSWLRRRLVGLISITDGRVQRVLAPPSQTQGQQLPRR